MQTIHTQTEQGVTVYIQGLGETVKVLHVTDSHISCDTEVDRPYEQYSARMNNAFKDRNTTEAFRNAMVVAQKENVDLIALTGDGVNYPSRSSVEYVANVVKRTGIQSMYTAGNHDWHYEGMVGSSEALRQEWREKRLMPLYAELEMHFSSIEVGGICFIAIDNSTYQVDEEQLASYRQQSTCGLPIVLLIHIPLSLPIFRGENRSTLCGDPAWGAATDGNYEIERRERWSEAGNKKSTVEFLDAVINTQNLIAILCGHIHKERVDAVNSHAVQYVTGPGFQEDYRLIEYRPI